MRPGLRSPLITIVISIIQLEDVNFETFSQHRNPKPLLTERAEHYIMCKDSKSFVHYRATQSITTYFKVHWGDVNCVIKKCHKAAGRKYAKMLITSQLGNYG